jgi:hypothetical protein
MGAQSGDGAGQQLDNDPGVATGRAAGRSSAIAIGAATATATGQVAGSSSAHAISATDDGQGDGQGGRDEPC